MDDALQQKFPDLKQGSRPSALGSVNGFGTSLVGRRDPDAETGTYVITHCITGLFIPLIALAAYRVAPAQGGGWYILGRVPLSPFARRWNALLLIAVLGLAGGLWWNHHIHTPEYLAGQKLDAADQAAASGDAGRAAQLCREVIDQHKSHADEGKKKLAALIQDPPGAPSQAAEVYAVAVDLHRRKQCPVPDLFDRGKALAERYAAADPAASLALLEVIAPYAPDAESELALRRNLLERLVAQKPNDPAVVSRLAIVYEAKGEREKCRTLLMPLEARLGTLDGAAVLGRIYAADGQTDKAFALLGPFVETRLPAFQNAEKNWIDQSKAAQARVVDLLSKGNAPGFDYARYDRVDKVKQGVMVSDYIDDQLKDDSGLREARRKLSADAAVVPAALDLGMVRLQRAQAVADPSARKRELEAAEKVFLSVRGVAAESDQFRLNLGQVYYWLGRPAEGKKQFDDLLAARNRSAEVVMMVSSVLREVGAIAEARKLVEDAYTQETDPGKKYQIARARSLLHIDTDDEILWLGRSNPDEPSVQAALAFAQGSKAAERGDDESAIRDYRRTVELNEKMPDNPSTLNNAALAHFSLAQLTQDQAEFARGLDKLDKAIALLPSDSILLHNAASLVLDNALRDVASSSVDFRVLKATSGWEVIPFLYSTASERKTVVDRLAGHPGLIKARGYCDRLMTLAPKRPDTYESLTVIHNQLRNVEGLAAVLSRLQSAELDLTDSTRRTKEWLSGAEDAKRVEDYRKALVRAEAILKVARQKPDRTFTVAVARVIQLKSMGWMLKEPVDTTALVKLAEEAHSAKPTDGTRTALITALLLRGNETMSRQDARYRSLAEKTKRSFGPVLLLHTLTPGDSLGKVVAENPDVRRLSELTREDYRLEPEAVTPRMWAVLTASSPDETKGLAAQVAANERSRLRRQIERVLNPLAANSTLEEFWALKSAGRDKDADQVMSELAARGVPVP